MKFMTLAELMQSVGCTAYPARWNALFDTVMRDFDENGCPYTDPAYYEKLHEEYGVFVKHLDLIKEAAVAVGAREPLARFLLLLVTVLQDRENIYADIKEFKAPISPADAPDLAVDMLTALAIFTMVPYTARTVSPRNLPAEIYRGVLQNTEQCIDYFSARYGRPGCCLFDWYQRAIDCKLLRIGRFEVELFASFRCGSVYENGKGERVTLCHNAMLHRDGLPLGAFGYTDESGAYEATLTETEDAYIGYPYLPDGFVKAEPVTLLKSEWCPVIAMGDPVVSLHIPTGGSFTPAVIDDSLAEIKALLAKHYPEFNYKAFVCHSWLLDPVLSDLLGEEANIARFGRRFVPMGTRSNGNAVLNFVFFDPERRIPVEEWLEETRLHRALKAHYLQGKVVYEFYGYFFA